MSRLLTFLGPCGSIASTQESSPTLFSKSQWPCLDFGNEIQSHFICLKKRERIRHVDLKSNVTLSALSRLRMNRCMREKIQYVYIVIIPRKKKVDN